MLPSQRTIIMGSAFPWRRYATEWGLVSHWKLNEASGNAVDSYSSNTLTDTNTVTAGDGLSVYIPSSRSFAAASSERFTIADNAPLSTGDVDFWMSCWVRMTTVVDSYFIAKYGGGTREYALAYVAGATQRFRFVTVDASDRAVSADSVGAATAGVWYFLLGWHDSVNNTIKIRVNNGGIDSAANANGVNDSADAFEIGGLGSFAGNYVNGRIAAASFGKSPPGGIAGVIDDISRIQYNNGNGRRFD